jgi:hypothetical protein
MDKDGILAAIAAAKKEGSFKIRLVFAIGSEISRVRSFVTMLKGGGIAVEDETMMKLRLVAISRMWQEDIDRVVIMDICDNFDENEFVARFEFAFENIEALPRVRLANEPEKHDGVMSPKKAIRKALANGQRELKIVFPSASDTDVLLFMDLVKHGYVSFADHREQLVFEDAMRHRDWSLGGRFLADIFIEKNLPEHDSRRILDGAHAQIKGIKVVR